MNYELNGRVFDEVLTEAADFFSSHSIKITGEGYKEIATDEANVTQYIEMLTEGCSEDTKAEMSALMLSTNNAMLRESQSAGIAPIASLSMPTIRKLWPKFGLKEALKREVAKSPREVVSYTMPYMLKGSEKVYLPKGLNGTSQAGDVDVADILKGKVIYNKTTVGLAGMVKADFHSTSTNYPAKFTVASNALVSQTAFTADPLNVADSGSLIKAQALDPSLSLVQIIEDTTVGGSTTTKIFNVNATLDITNSIYKDVAVSGGVITVVVRADLGAGTALVALITKSGSLTGTAYHVVLRGKMSSIYNEVAPTVGFDIGRKDIVIAPGEHINASLPIETLNDMMALYNLDGTKEAIQLMTNTVSMKLDLEVLDFLERSFLGQPGDIFTENPGSSEFSVSFSCTPAAGFAGGPKEWREELKPLIDYLAQKIINNTYLQDGVFNLVCNPVDANIISNIDWQFRGGQGTAVDGVKVNYSVGTYLGAHAYKVIASTQVPAGVMYVVFIPDDEKTMTYKYYPYTFSTEQGYVDPNHSRVPSVMLTKRDTFAEFLPAIGLVNITNNGSSAMFRTSVPTSTAA